MIKRTCSKLTKKTLPLDVRHKLNEHKTQIKRCHGRLKYVQLRSCINLVKQCPWISFRKVRVDFEQVFTTQKFSINTFTTNIHHHIETNQLICIANELIGFYMVRSICHERVKDFFNSFMTEVPIIYKPVH